MTATETTTPPAEIPAQAAPGTAREAVLRDQLSSLRGLLVLSMLMTESGDEQQILHLAATSVPSFARCRATGLFLADTGWCLPVTDIERREAVRAQLDLLGRGGGHVTLGAGDDGDDRWAWALPLRGLGGTAGHLIVTAESEPSEYEQFLLQALVQQTGVALANARLHAKERATAEDLRATNAVLGDTVRALRRTTDIHDRFTRIALADQGFTDVDPAGALSLSCSARPCLTPGAEVASRVRVEVPLPLVPGFVRDAVPLAVPVESRFVASVDEYAARRP